MMIRVQKIRYTATWWVFVSASDVNIVRINCIWPQSSVLEKSEELWSRPRFKTSVFEGRDNQLWAMKSHWAIVFKDIRVNRASLLFAQLQRLDLLWWNTIKIKWECELPAISMDWRCVHPWNDQDLDVPHETMQRPSNPLE